MKKTLPLLLTIFGGLLLTNGYSATIVNYSFTSAPYLRVTSTDSNLTSSDVALSSSSITTNVTTGSYFPNEPYIQGTGWTQTTQAAAKNFNFTITANAGYTFSITNVTLNAYATSTGPTGVGLSVNGTSILSQNSADSSLFTLAQSVSMTGLTTATISIQGWLNGSRTSNGNGDFRLDDIIVSGTASAILEPSTYALLDGLAALGFVAYRRKTKLSR